MSKKKVAFAEPIPLQHIDGRLNWEICCICQQKGGELSCPAKHPIVSMKNVGYTEFARNVATILSSTPNHIFPCGRKAENYDEGCGVKETLINNEAKWHKKCLLKYTTRFSVENLASPACGNTEKKDATRTRSSSVSINSKDEVCFLCKKRPEKNEVLHKCMTYEIFNSIKDYATKANDTQTLAFLAEGDLVAQEAKYHSVCVLNLYRKGKAANSQEIKGDSACESLAFADLLLYMHAQIESDKDCAFRAGSLKKLYNDRLSQLLGREDNLPDLHETRFREKILLHFPGLQAIRSGREYILTVQNNNIMNNILNSNEDLDALAVNRFVRNIRNSVFATEIVFRGNFEENCEENCIPPPLLALVNMILYGSSITSESRTTQPAVTISQLILANMMKRRPTGNVTRHSTTREPPFPLYLGLSIYGSSRDKELIDNLHRRGISVSSNRIYELTAQLGRHVVQKAIEDDAVCPSVLKNGFFTVGALDNIDVKPSSTTSQGEFHGTGISLFQLPLNGEVSTERTYNSTFEDAASPRSRQVPSLPLQYSELPEFNFPSSQPTPPLYSIDVCTIISRQAQEGTRQLWHREVDWLENVHNQLVEMEPVLRESISWSAFRAVKQGTSPLALANNSLLPLFEEKSTSPAMIKHGMDMIQRTTQLLNPDQTPVICVDQPLFANAKLLQWNLPRDYGEKKFVVLFGPLHIEQNFLRLIGEVMEGSGWSGIIANSGVLPGGSAEGLLKVGGITKSRLYHEYTAAALYSLLSDAYVADHPNCDVSKEQWINENAAKSPTFKYWLLVLRLELLLLKFLRSVREAHFEDFKEAIILMLPWFFSLGHHLYARWLTVHACDLLSLETQHPEMHRRFSLGAFVVRKTLNAFSCLGIDHAHEQNNAVVKSKGGALGLTQDSSSLRRWTIAGPEVARLLAEFEGKQKQPGVHHEQYTKFQAHFYDCCAAVKESFSDCDNPFLNKETKLINIETRVEIGEGGIKTLRMLENRGITMLDEFLEKRLRTQEVCFYTSVQKPKFEIFNTKKIEKKTTISELKNDVQLFQRLFIVSLSRSLDLNLFFKHENQACPPSLSTNGRLRSGDKCLLIPILEKLIGNEASPETCDGIIIDGASLVRMIKVNDTPSFEAFGEKINSYCTNFASKMNSQRVDIAWDQYNGKSLKSVTRETRGSGARRPGLPQKGAFPKTQKQWEDYLKNDENKEELFKYLAELSLKMDTVQIVTNVNDIIKVSSYHPQGSSLNNVCCASMEEADGRMFLHAKDMVDHGAKSIVIRCSDTDVVILAVSFFHELQKLGLKELWVYFGIGTKNKRFLAIHAIARSLGEARSSALRGFHAFSGCDTVSFFSKKGKRSAWTAWNSDDTELTDAFIRLGMQSPPTEETISVLERFVVKLYGAHATCDSIDASRQHLFATEGKLLLHIPPTFGSLVQHTRRAAYQAGQIWGRSLQADWTDVPSPVGWGWKGEDGRWEVHWTDLDDIWKTCRDLSVCGCASDCSTMRCACRKAGVICALSCRKCKGSCANSKKENLPHQTEDEEDVDGDLEEVGNF